MAKPALTIEPEYRSKLEKDVAEKFAAAGVEYGYESQHILYTVPAREAKYLPDFSHNDCPIIIEPKGRFGGNYEGFGGKRMVGSKDAAVKERQKFILLKEQHPELDIRFIFSRASTPIYPKSKTVLRQMGDGPRLQVGREERARRLDRRDQSLPEQTQEEEVTT
jgi:hypothetical protein